MTKGRAGVLAAALLLISTAAYVYLAGSVDNKVTKDDAGAIHAIFGVVRCSRLNTFEGQISCIQDMQLALKSRISNMRCAARGTPIEPANFLARGYGCCYDRARTLEKALHSLGMQTRHVAIYDATKYGPIALLMPGVASHATLEVLTTKGWMGVDSNEPFILLTRNGQPFTYSDLPRKIDEAVTPVQPRDFFSQPTLIVYGLHSRHGFFHGINAPTPEINFSEFFRFNF